MSGILLATWSATQLTATTAAALPLVFLGGLLGSAHCIGMCGPFALMVGGSSANWRQNLGRQIVYTLGRVSTYSLLGAAAGGAGLYLQRQLPQLVNVAAGLAVLAGAILVYMGLASAGVLRRSSTAHGDGACLWFAPYLRPLFRSSSASPLFVAGLLTGLLPCGLVYGFLALAASSQDVGLGAATMALFGAGTAPVMMLTGIGASAISIKMRQKLFTVAAWCVVLTGMFSVYRGVSFFSLAAEASAVEACPFCQ